MNCKCPNPVCKVDGVMYNLTNCGDPKCDFTTCLEWYHCRGCGASWIFKEWLVGNEIHDLKIPTDYKGHLQ